MKIYQLNIASSFNFWGNEVMPLQKKVHRINYLKIIQNNPLNMEKQPSIINLSKNQTMGR